MILVEGLGGMPGTFPHVIQRPQRLKVGKMKTSSLLFGVRQIERNTGPLVVNVPRSVISPRHSRRKLSFNMFFQFIWRTPDKLRSFCNFLCAPKKGAPNPGRKRIFYPPTGVAGLLNLFPFPHPEPKPVSIPIHPSLRFPFLLLCVRQIISPALCRPLFRISRSPRPLLIFSLFSMSAFKRSIPLLNPLRVSFPIRHCVPRMVGSISQHFEPTPHEKES
jgi:hypothetical protein